MRFWDRVLVALAALVNGAMAVWLWQMEVMGTEARTWLAQAVRTLDRSEALLLALALALLAVYLLTLALPWRRPERVIVMGTSLGEVRIALRAVENLILRAASGVRGVKEVQTQVGMDRRGLVVHLAALVAPDLNVPAMAEEVQRRVEAYLQETVGVTISGVHVRVRNIAVDPRARVE